MVKPTTGFLTSQGRYFTSETDAKLDEARESLRDACEEHQINFDKFLDIISKVQRPLFVYLTQAQGEQSVPVSNTSNEEPSILNINKASNRRRRKKSKAV